MPPSYFTGKHVGSPTLVKSPAKNFPDFIEEFTNPLARLGITSAEYQAMTKKEKAEAKMVGYATACTFDKSPWHGRKLEHACPCNLIILDVDNSDDARPFVEDPASLVRLLKKYNFAAYQTISSTPASPRIRVIVEADSIAVEKYPDTVLTVGQIMGLPKVTRESAVAVQPMFKPTVFRDQCKDLENPLLVTHFDGRAFTVADISTDVNSLPGITSGSKPSRVSSVNIVDDFLTFFQFPVHGLTLEQVKEALTHIDADCSRPDWLEIAAGMKHQFGSSQDDEAYAAFDEWSATGSKYEDEKDTAAVWRSFQEHPTGRRPTTIRSLLKRAVEGGWKGNLAQWAETVFYDRSRKEYLVLDGHENWFPVNESMLRRQCRVLGMQVKPPEGGGISAFDMFLFNLQTEKGVAYAGALAGHPKGPRTVNGSLILVTTEPSLIAPQQGDFPTLQALLNGMFGSNGDDQLAHFYGWLQNALRCLHARTRKPGQVLVIAGPAECGKSLLQTIITWLFGGRESKPYAYMTGATDFNSELFAAEHLRLDDEQASTDMRARRAFGARVKELLFGHAQRMHAKNRDALTLDPIWRMTITLNEEPESLQVLPPLDESLEDKFIILRASKKPMPMPTGTTEQTAAFAATLRQELPAFIHWLMHEFVIPEPLKNDRCGIRYWHHPELLTAIRELSPQARLLSLIDKELFHARHMQTQWEGTADELEHELTGGMSGVRQEAAKLLSWNNACGTFLGRLAKDMPARIESARTPTVRKWVIHPPEADS
jgi:hypothetical protein